MATNLPKCLTEFKQRHPEAYQRFMDTLSETATIADANKQLNNLKKSGTLANMISAYQKVDCSSLPDPNKLLNPDFILSLKETPTPKESQESAEPTYLITNKDTDKDTHSHTNIPPNRPPKTVKPSAENPKAVRRTVRRKHFAYKGDVFSIPIKYLLSDDPELTIKHIINLAINLIAHDKGKCKQIIKHYFLSCDLDHDNWKQTANKRFAEKWDLSSARMNYKTYPTLPISLFVNQVVAEIPADDLKNQRQNNQKIKPMEIALILQSLTNGLIKVAVLNDKYFRVVANAYFLSDSFKSYYLKKSGRKLNDNKLGRITTILHDYKLIEKIRRKDDASRNKCNLYKPGDLSVIPCLIGDTNNANEKRTLQIS